MSLEQQLLEALEKSTNEREIQRFLKKNIFLISSLNEHAVNFVECVPEFRFGSNYVADYLILSATSGWWNVIFIEVESHKKELFSKGEQSPTLRHALKQLEDWDIWVGKNESYLRQQLANVLKKFNAPAFCSNAALHSKAETEIRDPKTNVNYHYKALIGRRDSLDQNDQERRFSIWRKGKIEVVTFDRLIDSARRIDRNSPKRIQ